MVSPILSATKAFTAPLQKFISRATTMPSTDVPNINLPEPPTPASQPTAKPARKGMQQSFLSGVAASALSGGGQSRGGGKTLLGQ